MWPWITFGVILYFIQNLRIFNVSIHRIFYQNHFINECARKKKAKSRNHSVTDVLWDIEELTFLKTFTELLYLITTYLPIGLISCLTFFFLNCFPTLGDSKTPILNFLKLLHFQRDYSPILPRMYKKWTRFLKNVQECTGFKWPKMYKKMYNNY